MYTLTFSSILNTLAYYDVIFVEMILFFIGSCVVIFFYTNNQISSSVKNVNNISFTPTLSTNNYKEFTIRFGCIINLCILFYLMGFHGNAANIWFSHIYISNFNLAVFFGILIIFLPLYKIIVLDLYIFKNIQKEYYITLLLLNIILPLIFFVNTILTFYFILELISILVLYQFIVGKDWELLSTNNSKKLFYNNYQSLNTAYVNMLFFQYWVSFFSSILIVYSTLIFLYNYGTTEWIFLNFFINTKTQSWQLVIAYCLLLLAFILKLGLAPVHFYKLEVYKGLPFISILFYTIYFFLIFFLFFSLLICTYLPQLGLIWYYSILTLICIGMLCLTFLLFDIKSIKAFFAYSTIANSLGFSCLLVSLI